MWTYLIGDCSSAWDLRGVFSPLRLEELEESLMAKFDCSRNDVCCLSRIGIDIGIGVAIAIRDRFVGLHSKSDCDTDPDRIARKNTSLYL